MTVTTAPITPAIAAAETPEGLFAFTQPDCAGMIWSRRPAPAFQAWIDGLTPQKLPKARVILRPEVVRDAVTQICDHCGTPDCAERTLLIDDTAALAAIFAEMMDASFIRLRLDVIDSNACRKFHIDTITARLICTYRGTGTQYGYPEGDDDPSIIHTVPTGAPLLLRGKLWPDVPQSGLVHRSPPIEGSGETRLVLVLDPAEDPEGSPERRLH